MVSEGEKYKEEDAKQRERVDARNQLEAYAFNIKQALNDAGEKLSQEDKRKGMEACEESLRWVEMNSLAEKEEYESKRQELESVCSGLMTKIHQGGTGQSSQGPHPSQTQSGSTVEEVD